MPYRNKTAPVKGVAYYYPYTYTIHVKGSGPANSQWDILFASLWNGEVSDEKLSQGFILKVDDSGQFDITRDVHFTGPIEILYMMCN